MKQPWRDIPLLELLACRFKELRVAKNVSQEKVYEDTGVHIGKVETARYNLTISTISRLCRYYGVSLEELFADIELK